MKDKEKLPKKNSDHESMSFPKPKEDPWTKSFLKQHLQGIGVPNPRVSDADVASIKEPYEAPSRRYHNSDHGAFVGTPDVPDVLGSQLSNVTQEEAASSLAVAGLWHDTGYKQVDASSENPDEGAWSPSFTEYIGGMAAYKRRDENGKSVFTTYVTPEGREDPITQMTAMLFDVPDKGIIHNQGGNEFDSALAAAKFLERYDAPPKAILADAALIAGTVPFKQSVERDEENNIVGDGYMGQLARRVKETRLTRGGETYQPDWADVDDIMRLTVQMANRDVSAFMGDLPAFIKGGRDVKKEEIPVLRKGVKTMGELVVAAEREASAPLLYGWIKDSIESNVPVPAENVPSIYFPRNEHGEIEAGTESYPPRDVYEAAVEKVRENGDYASLFFESHELGIYTAASIATQIGEPNAAVPGFVDSEKWDSRSIPRGRKFDELIPNERIVYEELMDGNHQVDVDTATPHRSPIAGILLGSLGKEGIRELSRTAAQLKENYRDQQHGDNPFANPELARDFMEAVTERVGEENIRTIITELHRVAVDFQDDPERGNQARAENLRQLAPKGEIWTYQTE